MFRTHVGGRAQHHAGAGQGGRAGERRFNRFRETEVQHLDRAVEPDLDIRGFEIAVDDPLLVRRFESLGNLSRDRQSLVDRHRPAHDPLREVFPIDELHDEREDATGFLEAVDVCNVRVVECGERLCFAREPRKPVAVAGEHVGQYLECDIAVQLGISRAVDVAHGAGAERSDDFIGTHTNTSGEDLTTQRPGLHRGRSRSRRPTPAAT